MAAAVVLEPHPDALADLVVALLEHGRPSLAWAVRWAAEGDPLPDAWRASANTEIMAVVAHFLDRTALVAILRAVASDGTTYPFARDCLDRAAREIEWGGSAVRTREWVRTAILHYPGRNTHLARPQQADALRRSLCEGLRQGLPEPGLGHFA